MYSYIPKSITSAGFRQTKDGQLAFYPNGVWGKGYLIPDQAKVDEIVRFQTIARLLLFGAYAIVFVFFPPSNSNNSISVFVPLIVLSVAFFGLFRWLLSRKLVGLPSSPEELTVRQGYQELSKSERKGKLWLLTGVSILGLGLGLGLLSGSLHLENFAVNSLVLGLSLLVSCSIVALTYGYMLLCKYKVLA